MRLVEQRFKVDHSHKPRHRREVQFNRRGCQDHLRAVEPHRLHNLPSEPDLDLDHRTNKQGPEKDKDQTPKEDWVKRTKPSNVEVRIHAAKDYARQEQRISFLRSGREFIISTVEGPHSTHTYGANLAWRHVSETIDLSCSTIFQHSN